MEWLKAIVLRDIKGLVKAFEELDEFNTSWDQEGSFCFESLAIYNLSKFLGMEFTPPENNYVPKELLFKFPFNNSADEKLYKRLKEEWKEKITIKKYL